MIHYINLMGLISIILFSIKDLTNLNTRRAQILNGIGSFEQFAAHHLTLKK